jgi:branched-chain amino acid aminotransferase
VLHPFILHNDEIVEASARRLSPGQVGLLSGWGVFTTLRVAEGVLFAFERHWARITRDARLLHVTIPDDPEPLRRNLCALVESNRAPDCTLRLAIVRNAGGMWEGPSTGRGTDIIALTANSKDWGHGVKLALQPQARHSGCMFAGTKILSWAQNLTWIEIAQERGFDEVILLNERGEVSECTSANIFIAQGNRIWTPPLQSSGCLPGITREVLLNEVRVPAIEIGEKDIRPEELESADEVFITSTTRDLLPVIQVEGRKVGRTDQARAKLAGAFREYLAGYIASRKPQPAGR